MKEMLAELKYGIIQAGMSVRISLAEMVGAVCEEGGMGVIGASLIGVEEPDVITNFQEANTRALEREINRTREITRKPFAINILKVMTNYSDMVVVAIKNKVAVIFCGSASPLDLPKYLSKGDKTKLVPKVSSGKSAATITKWWLRHHDYLPDALAIEGPMAGGHLGFSVDQLNDPTLTLERLVKEVREAIRPFEIAIKRDIPLIVAGGIYTGADVYRLQQLGVFGFKLATRFVPTKECAADIRFKEVYVHCQRDDLMIIESPVGLPGRAIRNHFLEDVAVGKKSPVECPYHCITSCRQGESPYCIARALKNASRGNLARGFVFAGSNAYRTKKILTVKEVMAQLCEEYEIASLG